MNRVPSANVKIGQAAKILGVSVKTLRRWEAAGKISSIRTPGGTRFYALDSLKNSGQKGQYLSLKETALSLGVSERTILRWEKKGEITSFRTPAGYKVYNPQSLKNILEKPKDPSSTEIKQNNQTNFFSKIAYMFLAITLFTFLLIGIQLVKSYLNQTEQAEVIISQTNLPETDILGLDTKTQALDKNLAQEVEKLAGDLNTYQDQISNRLITKDAFIGESVIDSYGNIYPARTITHSGLRSSVGTPNNRFFGIYANRFTLDTGGNLKVFGQTTFGDTPDDYIKLVGKLTNDLIPAGNGEISLGNGDKYFKKAYINSITADTGGFTSLSVGNLTASTNNILPLSGDLFAENVISSSTVRDYVAYNGTSDTRGELPVLLKLQNGSFLIIFRIGTSHASDNGRLVAYSSTDGKTWSSLGTIADDSTYDDRNPSAIQLSDGTIVVGYITYDYSAGSTVDMKVIKSTNNGASWGSPISQSNTNSPYGHMIQLSNGHILMPVYGRQSGDTNDRSMIYRSTDTGTTFSVYSTIASSQGSEDINEAGIFKLANGNIAAAIRTDTNPTTKMFFQTSTDNGTTWNALNGLSTITGHSPNLIQMPSGRLYLFVRYNARRPNATAYYVSDDNGSTWFGPNLVKFVSPAGSAGGGYPSAVKYNDDTIMVAYWDEVDRDIYVTFMGDWPYTASLNIGARVAGPAIFGGGIMAGTDSNENLILTPSAKIYVANNKTFGFLGASGSGDSLTLSVDTSNNAQIATANANPIYMMADDGGIFFQTYSGSWLTRMTVTDEGNVGIGTSLPGATLQISGNQVIGFGTTSRAGPSSGLAVSGNVGIGTTTANSALTVIGGASIGGAYNFTAPTNGLVIQGNVGIGISAPSQQLQVNAGTSSFVVTSGGNVGVGTTSPSRKLMVSQTAAAGGVFIDQDGDEAGLEVDSEATTFNSAVFRAANYGIYTSVDVSGTNNANYAFLATRNLPSSATNDALAKVWQDNSGDDQPALWVRQDGTGDILQLLPQGTVSFVVNSSGNLGIGNSAPAVGLSVSSNALIGYGNGINGPSSGLAVSGNVGIGTTSPRMPLEVWGNGTYSATFLNGNVGIGITSTGGTTAATLVVSSPLSTQFAINVVTGSVGIGTSIANSGYALDVGGKVRASGGFNGNCLNTAAYSNGGNCNQDVAELYNSSEDVEPADLLTIDTSANKTVKKTFTAYDQKIIGVVSTSPGLILGLNGADVFLGGETSIYPNKAEAKKQPAVALSGKVPVKVSTENGPIKVGDYLTSSSTPGVAMKAIRPGQVVGKALEPFDGSNSQDDPTNQLTNNQIGKILAFINVSYADPGNFFSSLSLDPDGNLIVPRIKAGKLTLEPSVASASAQLSIINSQLSIESDPNYISLAPQTPVRTTVSASYIDLGSKISSLEERIAALESKLLSNETIKQASDSAQLLNSSITQATSDLNLTPPDILLATKSAQLADLNSESDTKISGMLSAYQAEISDNLKVFGETTLGNTLIAGDLTIDATLSITGTSITSLPTLYLQAAPGAESLDIFNGKVTINKEGNFMAQSVTATEYLGVSGKSVGSGIIVAGTKSVEIPSPLIKKTSKILITPSVETTYTLSVSSKIEGEKFTASMPAIAAYDILFDWFIINEVSSTSY